MTYTDLIWDFNGTLYDDVQACLDSIDTLLVRYGKPPLGTKERYRGVFGFPIEEYYRRAGFDFDEVPFEKLAHEWVELYFANSIHSGLYPGARKTLDAFRSIGYRHTLLSATELGMLGGQVGALGIAGYFEEILGLGDIYAHSKTELGRMWKKRHPDRRPLFIGDTVHDAETADAMGADCVLISAGHQSGQVLLATGKPVLDSIRELVPFVGAT